MWNLKPDERLREWKAIRKQVGQQSLDEACKNVNHIWCYAPYVAHFLDPDQKNSVTAWPDPWTLLYENYYCDLAKALGMLYTLYLSDHKPADIELLVCRDSTDRQAYNIVSLAKGKYILNFTFDTVVNNKQLPKTLVVQYRYRPEDLNIDLY